MPCGSPPKSPAALAYLKLHPELAGDSGNSPPAGANAKKENEAGSGLTTIQTNLSNDTIAAALDDPNPQSIIVGHGHLAFDSEYLSDEDSFESDTYSKIKEQFLTIDSSRALPLQGVCVSSPPSRVAKKSKFNVNQLSYETDQATCPEPRLEPVPTV